MRKIFRIFAWDWKERIQKKENLLSHSFPYPANKLRIKWEEYNLHSPDKQVDPIIKKLLPYQLDWHFENEVMGRSHIHIIIQSDAKSIWGAFLFFTLYPFYFNIMQNYKSRLEEFSFYFQGEKSLLSYLSFQKPKKFTLFPAQRFQLKETYIADDYLDYNEACFLLPANYQPATSFQGRSKIIKIQSIVHSIDYGIWQEEIEGPNIAWFMDIFLEVRAVHPFANSEPIFRYMGSQYSHEEIAIHCSQLRVKRFYYPTSRIIKSSNVFISKYGKGESKHFTSRILENFRETRFEISEDRKTYQEILLPDRLTIKVWKGGIYELDRNRIDLPPLF